LSEPLQNPTRISAVEFSADGRHFLTFADKGELKVWDLITAPVPVPWWFCDLVEAVAAKRRTANHEAEPIGRDGLQPLRERLATTQDADFYSRWAKWFLWERLNDPAAPMKGE